MARGDEKEKDARQREAVQRLGLDGRASRVFGSHVTGAAAEAAIMSLPISPGDFTLLRDPETGTPYFVLGIDDLDGDSIIP